MNTKNIIGAIVSVCIIIIVLVLAFIYTAKQSAPVTAPVDQTATTTTTTSSSASSGSVTLKEGQTATVGGLSLNFKTITNDSRCATDVQCIQAGSVTANITLKAGTKTQNLNLTSNKGATFPGYLVTITAVSPSKISTKVIDQSEYRVTFLVTPTVQ